MGPRRRCLQCWVSDGADAGKMVRGGAGRELLGGSAQRQNAPAQEHHHTHRMSGARARAQDDDDDDDDASLDL